MVLWYYVAPFRYIYEMYYKRQAISRAVYDFCVKMKIADAALIAKWKKPGYDQSLIHSTHVTSLHLRIVRGGGRGRGHR